ncbi:MAG: GNAT family N-acetyltransferase [Candidatus Berkelbacteria bacterium]|nr:GNAT family N-acetyltransferase [Candidatus Berkelbacteria bacterium]
MTNENFTIRKAVEADYPSVNFLYHKTYTLYHDNMPDQYKKMPASTLPKGTFLNIIEDKKELMIVAEKNKEVVGVLYAITEKDDGDDWAQAYNRVSVEEISVSPKHFNQGIGTKLMQAAENWAKEQNISDVTALVYAFNDNAVNFYKKNYFTPYSVRMNKKIK